MFIFQMKYAYKDNGWFKKKCSKENTKKYTISSAVFKLGVLIRKVREEGTSKSHSNPCYCTHKRVMDSLNNLLSNCADGTRPPAQNFFIIHLHYAYKEI